MNIPPPTPAQARTLWCSVTALAVAAMLGLLAMGVWALAWVLERLSAVLLPIVFAMILAYILDPVVEYFVRKRVPRVWSVALVYFLGVLLAAGVVASVVPDAVRETRELVRTLPENTRHLQERVRDFLEHSPLAKKLPGLLELAVPPAAPAGTNQPRPAVPHAALTPLNTNFFDASLKLRDSDAPPDGVVFRAGAESAGTDIEPFNQMLNVPLSETVITRVTEVFKLILRWAGTQFGKVTVWGEFLIGFIMVPVYLFYFLLEKQDITSRWTDYLPLKESKMKDEVVFVLKAINDCLIVFFRGQVLVALCVGALLTGGYLMLGLNYAVLIGLVAAVFGVVPYLGAAMSLVLALTVAVLQFGDWPHPLLVLAIAGVVKVLEDFVISPKIIGDRSGLHPLTIIIAVLVGTTALGGILGAILAIPLTAVLRTLMFRYIWKPQKT